MDFADGGGDPVNERLSTAQRKPSRVDTSIAFSRPPSESRNASSFSISRLVSGRDSIGLMGMSHFIAKPCRLITPPLEGNEPCGLIGDI